MFYSRERPGLIKSMAGQHLTCMEREEPLPHLPGALLLPWHGAMLPFILFPSAKINRQVPSGPLVNVRGLVLISLFLSQTTQILCKHSLPPCLQAFPTSLTEWLTRDGGWRYICCTWKEENSIFYTFCLETKDLCVKLSLLLTRSIERFPFLFPQLASWVCIFSRWWEQSALWTVGWEKNEVR